MQQPPTLPSANVAANVAALRVRRGLSLRALSARLRQLGHPMVASVLLRVETGERRVDVDDLFALALALNVAPVVLLAPDADDGADPTLLTPTVETTTREAWQWMLGDGEPPAADERGRQDYADEAPVWVRKSLRDQLAEAEQTIREMSEWLRDPEKRARLLDEHLSADSRRPTSA